MPSVKRSNGRCDSRQGESPSSLCPFGVQKVGVREQLNALLTRVGFEPTSEDCGDDCSEEQITLTQRLRPLGHLAGHGSDAEASGMRPGRSSAS